MFWISASLRASWMFYSWHWKHVFSNFRIKGPPITGAGCVERLSARRQGGTPVHASQQMVHSTVHAIARFLPSPPQKKRKEIIFNCPYQRWYFSKELERSWGGIKTVIKLLPWSCRQAVIKLPPNMFCCLFIRGATPPLILTPNHCNV